jgi:hypothetical protein
MNNILKSGLYIITLSSKEKTVTQKLILK